MAAVWLESASLGTSYWSVFCAWEECEKVRYDTEV
ncbi:hypothetical protein CGLO_02810 [Colletotrichum gloeosporioides Cg-14]|uniref:Uncharacterized protein n=1 Tax=Colletotrichum gloeosporioides (strain Cg-14) TaxID=1237896 RepID=T0KY22_COLGC|nr:hypothetical protein CGLO_02810 [Colletotrichum gloeosporioides Cg-14]